MGARLLAAMAVTSLSWPAAAGAQAFTGTTADQQYLVPAGAVGVHIQAVGGKGGASPLGSGATGGGFGAAVSGDFAVAGGTILYVEVAGNGTDGQAGMSSNGPAGAGGANGGAAGGEGAFLSPGAGGGGGASDVRTCPTTASSCPSGSSLDSRLIVAAGGGGAGGYAPQLSAAGGAGGNAGFPGSDGSGTSGSGGQPGTGSAGGSGSPFGGTAGAKGAGGPGSAGVQGGSGGGGGGGLYGGQGGGAGGNTDGGGGGGGGSSFIGPGATDIIGPVTDGTGVPEVTITPIFPAAPICHNTTATTHAGAAVTVSLPCTVPSGVSRTFALVTPPSHGALRSINQATGQVVYTPARGYSGLDRFSYRATDGGGGSSVATATITITPPAGVAPVISNAKLSPAAFRAGSGTELTFSLSRAAVVKVTVIQLLPGRRVGARCSRRARRGRRCTVAVRRSTVSFRDPAGRNALGLAIAGLKPGSYTVMLVATAAGKASKPVTRPFRIT